MGGASVRSSTDSSRESSANVKSKALNAILCHYHPRSISTRFPTKTAWAEEWGTTRQRFDYWENKAIKLDLIDNYKSGNVPLPTRTLEDGTVIKYAAILDDDGEERDDVVAG